MLHEKRLFSSNRSANLVQFPRLHTNESVLLCACVLLLLDTTSAVNAMEACLLGVDAACMALLAAAALLWKESAKGESIYMAVMMMQVSAVVGEKSLFT